jgi:hypothetical protein
LNGQELTAKECEFLRLVCETGSVTDAALQAFDLSGEETEIRTRRKAAKFGSDIFKKAYIKKAFRKLQDELFQEMKERSTITKLRIVNELRCIAFADIADFAEMINGNVFVKDFKQIPKELRGAIQSISPTKYGNVVKFHNKSDALKQLGDLLKFSLEENSGTDADEVKLTPDQWIQIQQAREKK